MHIANTQNMTNRADRLLVNLTIISSILPHQRINAKSELLCVEPRTWLPEFVYRWWRADERTVCMRRINEIIDEAIEQIETASKTGDEAMASKFLSHLCNARPGLTNMKQTYAMDITTVAHIDLLIGMCTESLQKHRYSPPRTVIMNELPDSDDDDEDDEYNDDASH